VTRHVPLTTGCVVARVSALSRLRKYSSYAHRSTPIQHLPQHARGPLLVRNPHSLASAISVVASLCLSYCLPRAVYFGACFLTCAIPSTIWTDKNWALACLCRSQHRARRICNTPHPTPLPSTHGVISVSVINRDRYPVANNTGFAPQDVISYANTRQPLPCHFVGRQPRSSIVSILGFGATCDSWALLAYTSRCP
jgi:hypothetical protein